MLAVEWSLRILPILISVAGLLVALAAFSRSGQTAKMHIPAPIVAVASTKFVSITVRGDDGRRFGIAEIRGQHPMLRMYEAVEVADNGANIPTFKAPKGTEPSKRILSVPPTTVVVFHHEWIPGAVVRVKMLSRGDDKLSAWFTLPIF